MGPPANCCGQRSAAEWVMRYDFFSSDFLSPPVMDSKILWEILELPNFEYYPAGCAILEYGAAF